MRKLQDASIFALKRPAYQLSPMLFSIFPVPLCSPCPELCIQITSHEDNFPLQLHGM